MRERNRVAPVFDMTFTQPLAIPHGQGAIVVRSVRQAIDWIEGPGRRRIAPRTRDIAWRLRDAQHTRSQKHADDASDSLAHALAAEGVLDR
jgi:hypothetical protein